MPSLPLDQNYSQETQLLWCSCLTEKETPKLLPFPYSHITQAQETSEPFPMD